MKQKAGAAAEQVAANVLNDLTSCLECGELMIVSDYIPVGRLYRRLVLLHCDLCCLLFVVIYIYSE